MWGISARPCPLGVFGHVLGLYGACVWRVWCAVYVRVLQLRCRRASRTVVVLDGSSDAARRVGSLLPRIVLLHAWWEVHKARKRVSGVCACRAIARPRASDLYLQSGLHVLSESGVVREMCCENDVSSVEGRATKDDVLGVVRTRRL